MYTPASSPMMPEFEGFSMHSMLGEPCVYFFRHGETTLNGSNSFRGFVDVDLNDTGKKQAEESADYVKSVPFAALMSSDLKRAQQTLQAVRKKNKAAKDLVPEMVAAGRPWNVGKFAGKPKTPENKQELQMYADTGETIPGGESLGEFRSRFERLFRSAVDKAIELGGPVGLFGHASNSHEIGNILNADIDSLDVDPGGIVAVYLTRDGLKGRILKGRPEDPSQGLGQGIS